MRHSSKISAVVLSVNDPEKLAAFYCDILGMTRQDTGGKTAVGYGGQGAALILQKSPTATGYQHQTSDRYWKIAITLPHLDAAQAQIVARGIQATTPHQFRDIAYMSHLADPEGHVIELIQHSFKGNSKSTPLDPDAALGGGAHIGLITLRTSNIERELATCQQELGMAYLSRQAVSDLGFDLYFLAFSNESPPVADVNAVENREWLWQRPYTVLEFQHVLSGSDIVPSTVEVLIENSDETKIPFF